MTATLAAASASDIDGIMMELGAAAKAAADQLAHAGTPAKNRALTEAAAAIRADTKSIMAANAEDLTSARARGLSDALLDRLALNETRIEAMAKGLEDIAALTDPVGDVMAEWDRPNGLQIARVRTPLGVIGIIYESRPNVTADAGGLCLKAGNAAILRGGSEAVNSNHAIHACLTAGLKAAGLPEAAIQLVPTQDRAAVGRMLKMAGVIDVIVPRGGKSLVERVQSEASVPVFAHLEGICQVYVDKSADLEMARAVALNAKMRRTGICGAMETLLVDRAVLDTHLQPILDDLIAAGCEVRGDEACRAVDDRVAPASEEDWDTEYLAAILSVKVVDGVGGAIAHIARHSSGHTDSIIAEDGAAVARFLNEVNSAIVMHNASTQFADGGEFGMGAEIGISTGKMHARGPVGVEQLTSFKYIVRGHGQARP